MSEVEIQRKFEEVCDAVYSGDPFLMYDSGSGFSFWILFGGASDILL